MSNPSLIIGFGEGPTRARLQVQPGLETDLRRLALQYRSAVQVAPTVTEVDIDDLITNLRAIGDWPYSTVRWDDRLGALATDSVRDARAVENELTTPEKRTPVLSSGELSDILAPGWRGDLTDFQRRDISKLLLLRHGANFSVPGAGKTRVGLAVFQALRNTKGVERLLVIGPKSSFESWQRENEICFTSPLRMAVMEKDLDPAADAVIVNYERLAGSINSLSRWLDTKPTMIILDEAHRMKLGADGTYGAACLALGPHSRHRLILTGTPAPNGVKDLENLFSFVWPGTGRQRVVQAVGRGDLAAASRALRPLFTRTTKRELGLPTVTPVIHRLQLPSLHTEIYEALLGRLTAPVVSARGDLQELGRVIVYLLMAATSPALLSVGTTRYEPLAYRVPPLQVPPGTPLGRLMEDLPSYEMSPKFQEVLSIVKNNATQGRKTLVWSTFIRSLNTLRLMLSSFSPALVHGGTEDRDSEIRRFRKDPGCMVLLSNPATLGEGISLHHECHDAIYVDRDFAAGRFLQSLDRIHRLGLEPGTETRVTILVSDKTIDEIVEQRLKAKLDFMGQVLDDPAVQKLADLEEEPTVGGGLDQRDLQALMGHFGARTT